MGQLLLRAGLRPSICLLPTSGQGRQADGKEGEGMGARGRAVVGRGETQASGGPTERLWRGCVSVSY